MIVRGKRLRKLGLGVLHTMAFIYDKVSSCFIAKGVVLANDHMNPFHLAQNRAILDDVFIGRE